MNAIDPKLQFELLGPADIRAAWQESPIAFVPLGTCEWHGEHLPVGFDALAAHMLCLRAAARTGGLVLPPLYYGTGGGHSAYPYTVMLEPNELRPLLERTITRLGDFGVRIIALVSGHFAGEQAELVQAVAAEFSTPERAVLGLVASGIADPPIPPDHAALFETSLMAALAPDLVKLDRLPSKAQAPANDPDGNCWGEHRHNPSDPLYGIFGPDPRDMDAEQAQALLAAAERWIVKAVVGAKMGAGID